MSFPNCFLDSFAHYGQLDLVGSGNGQKWTTVGSAVSASMISSTNLFISPGTGLFGNSLRYVAFGSTSNLYVVKTLASLATWVVGFRFRTSVLAGQSIVALWDSGTIQVDLRITASTGTLFVTRNGSTVTGGTSTLTINANTWYYIEMMCTIASSISANTWQVNVNGTQYINVTTGQSSKSTGNATANQVLIGNPSASGNAATIIMDFCDLYVDGGGSVNGGAFWGDTKVECHWPVAAGTNTAWTGNAGNPVGCINDETPNGDVNFISDSTTNDKSSFTFQPLLIIVYLMVLDQQVLLYHYRIVM
jgi:hypothetical protein